MFDLFFNIYSLPICLNTTLTQNIISEEERPEIVLKTQERIFFQPFELILEG